jgi:hypothetical protein
MSDKQMEKETLLETQLVLIKELPPLMLSIPPNDDGGCEILRLNRHLLLGNVDRPFHNTRLSMKQFERIAAFCKRLNEQCMSWGIQPSWLLIGSLSEDDFEPPHLPVERLTAWPPAKLGACQTQTTRNF